MDICDSHCFSLGGSAQSCGWVVEDPNLGWAAGPAVPRGLEGLKGGHRHGSIFLPRQEVDTCRQKSHHPWQSVYGIEVDLDGRLLCGQRRRREGGGSRMASVPEQAGCGSVRWHGQNFHRVGVKVLYHGMTSEVNRELHCGYRKSFSWNVVLFFFTDVSICFTPPSGVFFLHRRASHLSVPSGRARPVQYGLEAGESLWVYQASYCHRCMAWTPCFPQRYRILPSR